MRERTGEVFQNKKTNKWIARVGYTKTNGKRTAIQQTADSRADAKKNLRSLLQKLESSDSTSLEFEKLTFKDLIAYYDTTYVKAAIYVDDRKVEGFRDVIRVKGFLKHFEAHFGTVKLKCVTYDDIRLYRNRRLETPTHYKKARTIATMNRELAYLRRILNVALRKGWIKQNPFNAGESLIDVSAERRRERILTIEEEKRLLEACTGRRERMKPFLICLLSTGARKGETLKLEWSDIDWENRLITFRALNTKTLKTRKVAITERLSEELLKLWESSDKSPTSRVFEIKSIRKAFDSACRDANIETGRPFGITLHSLRHTVAVRLVSGNFPLQFTARILGHQTVNTTYRYVSTNDETLYQAASILDVFHRERKTN